jgi:hypothetical protein
MTMAPYVAFIAGFAEVLAACLQEHKQAARLISKARCDGIFVRKAPIIACPSTCLTRAYAVSIIALSPSLFQRVCFY